ncbi:GtrA family protein [Caproiciproducens sp. NJN-50]|uniref:GtrA family protein n=1 Tax=Caproiciproducens sp. NJN-50 TaxID=2507162 RepID=UPI000FFE002F|nr:GtrA family protein [Caproiciproducens sp. NJN-50]QAT48377.1 GtrA family protein [Caproiciproducens sp. NJN-50]
MKRLLKLWRFLTSPEMILYLVFGVLTTVLNIAVFEFCYSALRWPWQAANALAWVLAVAFAFITNKLWVFRSSSFQADVFWRELLGFVAARLLSLGVDYACMWLFIDILAWNSLAAKAVDNVIVIAINYVLSKLVIFRKK